MGQEAQQGSVEWPAPHKHSKLDALFPKKGFWRPLPLLDRLPTVDLDGPVFIPENNDSLMLKSTAPGNLVEGQMKVSSQENSKPSPKFSSGELLEKCYFLIFRTI